MKCKIIESGVELESEKVLNAKFMDDWVKTGPLILYGNPDSWDNTNCGNR